jgi:hypothetical protein
MKTGIFLSIALFALSGCKASYDHTNISQVGSNELPASVTAQKITLAIGGVVTAHIAPFNSDNNALIGDVQSDDPSIVEVERTTGHDNYALLGIKTGTSSIHILAGGVSEATLQVEVTVQPPQ